MSALPVIFWLLSIWIYFDAKRWRGKGVPVRPGLVAGLLLLIYLAVSLFLVFWSRFLINIFMPYPSVYDSAYNEKIYATERIFSWVELLMPLALPAIYFLLRQRYVKIAALDNPPLPLAPIWTKWFFIVIFFLPIVLIAGFVFLFLRGGWGFF